MANSQNNPIRALIVCGLWLHIGLIGATALAAGLLQLFEGGPWWMWASALAVSGGALAYAGWRRGWITLEPAGSVSATSPDVSGEPTSRTRSNRLGALPVTFAILPQSNRRHDHAVDHPAPE